jgi:hypothetical protein
MTDNEAIKQAVEAFHNLSGDDVTRLEELNTKIQNHAGKWGVPKGGDKNSDGSKQMQWMENDPLIYEFLDFMDSKNLLPFFEWMQWSEGSELFTSTDPAKYDNIDVETALKLIYTATRKERFHDGTLAWAFELGGFQKLISSLIRSR